MGGNIFVSYRRDDSKHAAGRLVDRLHADFDTSQIFLDVDDIELGLDFVEVIHERVAACDIMLVVIGPSWLAATDAANRRRLEDPNDVVRVEIEAALNRGIRVIPILVDGAEPPRAEDLPESLAPLANRQATPLAHESFSTDAGRLTAALGRIVGYNSDQQSKGRLAPDLPSYSQFVEGPEPSASMMGMADAEATYSAQPAQDDTPLESDGQDLFGLFAALSPGIFFFLEAWLFEARWIDRNDITWLAELSNARNALIAPFLAGCVLIGLRFLLWKPYSLLSKVLTSLSLATMAIMFVLAA